MTILLYDYRELEERAGKHLKAWKVCHLILYSLAAIFGIVNYIALQSAMQLVDNKCVLYPRLLNFHMVLRPDDDVTQPLNNTMPMLEDFPIETTITTANTMYEDFHNDTTIITPNTTAQNIDPENSTEKVVAKRETSDNETMNNYETTVEMQNVTIVTGNRTHRLVLDTSRTLFARLSDCQYAEYMPVMSTVCALVWITLFTMCPGGGRPRSGLKQPWRILTPALLFALVMVGLTGHSFSRTNGGLYHFCAAFNNVTNSTTCSSVDPFLESSWQAAGGFGARAAGVRAASAAAWASWACVAALLLARCLAAPDFVVKRTGVFLVKDPQGKVTPYLRTSTRSPRRSPRPSPSKVDGGSLRSEATLTTDLATASVEQGQIQDSAPTSLMTTPIKKERNNDMIEMMYTPQEPKNKCS